MNDAGLIITFALILIIDALFIFGKLFLKVSNQEIEFKFPPIIPKWKKYSWDEIEYAEVIEFNPLLEYGGWGIRTNLDSWLYNVKGKHALKIILKNGKQRLIGTSNPEELKLKIKEIKNENIPQP